MFQKGNYIGGFDATEMKFCFSVFVDYQEYWFQILLEGLKEIHGEEITENERLIGDFSISALSSQLFPS